MKIPICKVCETCLPKTNRGTFWCFFAMPFAMIIIGAVLAGLSNSKYSRCKDMQNVCDTVCNTNYTCTACLVNINLNYTEVCIPSSDCTLYDSCASCTTQITVDNCTEIIRAYGGYTVLIGIGILASILVCLVRCTVTKECGPMIEIWCCVKQTGADSMV
jgi:hypothetical protein